MEKLAISDFDGTMYVYNDEEKNIPEANIQGISAWQAQGNLFAFCTGRNAKSMLLEIQRNGIPYDYMICNSGAIILNKQGSTLYKNAIPVDVLRDLVSNLELGNCIELMVSTKDKIEGLVLDRGASNLIKYVEKEQYKKFGLVSLCDKLEDFILDDVLQLTMSMTSEAATNEYVAKLQEQYAGVLQINYNLTFIDICAVGINKVKGINNLLGLINREIGEIITIGDAQNDVEMLKKYKGYTLDHATDDAKAVAQKVFPTVGDMLFYELTEGE